MSDVDDLLTWLRQQLDEDGRVARAWNAACWHIECCDDGDHSFLDRFDADRVLQEVEARRRRLERHEPVEQDREMLGSAWTPHRVCRWCTDWWSVREGGGRAALILWP